ncbi:dicarboxylate/amino acid:cation symporter [Haloferax mediterranei ATCC 33500]|uniref:Amino acid transporter n=1 Tax=Haloferax mediterranei (strain ATCC 33500 / DSM 1411 / JCM 8866 / NBRC 14739 / NCIMB 2177 / R-4) TaxID=523841 RepID=I3R540_HALMT|nr:dicarboxylate/amino acid:cation symporter [Haloferax mediterranei]AFK19350.1 glutamate/aspartate transport protein [Haloferax mediterranei ATCC 33500]AHZ21296.1 amino acid transporter [Haloferax mediterranei ATCC 33500]MDX5989455.1 dicarboxylate/amino acid:cation symporter [Haloferax mediterranei ATCC 33500]QCQ75818.1 dicarboxylate/amino acid:cation symporter [Haloferax mediterranei ATCC 33500]
MSNSAIVSLWRRYRSVSIVYRIGLAFVLGSLLGLVVGQPATELKPIGDLFVRLLKMLIVPIVVFTLLMGVRQLSPSSLGRVGLQVVGLYAFTSALAVAIGLGVGNLVDPGSRGLEQLLAQAEAQSAEAPNAVEVVLNIVPTNPMGAMAEGNVLPTIFFVVVFGLGLSLVWEETNDESVKSGIETFFDLADAGAEAMYKVVWGAMEFGVIGVFALMANVFGTAGVDAILPFSLLIGTMLVAAVVHIGVVYLSGLVVGLARRSPFAFLSGSRDAMVTALSIRSSSGTLPVTMSDADENLGIEERIYGFSLPLGATINMDGTAMYQGVAAIFAANIMGVNLSLVDQFAVVAVAVLASIGTAGVPGSGLIMLTLVLTQLGLPLEIVGLVAGVDPILDRIRTMVNVTGDLAVTTVVAKWNGAVDFTAEAWSDGIVPSVAD